MSVWRGPTSALKRVDRSANTVSQPPYPISQGRGTEAFRNVRVAPDQAQNYMVDDVLVADFRLTFG